MNPTPRSGAPDTGDAAISGIGGIGSGTGHHGGTDRDGAVAFGSLRIAVVGPLPPPPGGIANQTSQLARLLAEAGAQVELVQVNPPFPRWIAGVRGLRAAVRLPAYLWRLWRAAGRVQLLHVMANSGWSWHLFAAPAIWMGRLRGAGVVVNYRGGEAQAFLQRSAWLVRPTLRRAHGLIVPSAFLADLFALHGMAARIVPNIVDLARFQPPVEARQTPAILVARHLEPIYDNASALRALALLRASLPHAHMTICGEGPERGRLAALATQLGVQDAVRFTGRTRHAEMAALYRRSALLLNPSLADNMPNCVLEAWASGVPVVSTCVGGVPYLIHDGEDGMLVPAGDAAAMARAMAALLTDPDASARLAARGRVQAQRLAWPRVAPILLAQYRRVILRPPEHGYTAWVSRWLFPLQERCKRHRSHQKLEELEASQWWSTEAIEALQIRRLRALLQHAAQQVPYYREQWARLGFDPARVQQLGDLRRLPLLQKRDINGQRAAFRADDAGPLQRVTTGGSSGEPLVFYVGRARISHDVAAKWRATRWWGVDIGDREAVVWGSPIELKAQDRWRAWRDRLLRSELLPAFDLSPTRLDSYLVRLRRQRPAIMFGYPSVMCLLAQHARLRRFALDDLGVKVVFATAERLYDEQRVLLASAFGAPVANGYGGRDAGFLAHECPEGGLHVSAEDVIVEIVDADGQPVAPGVSGAIVTTHLASGDFPLIRYATGDVGAFATQPCPCGRGLPLLQRVEGRVTDFVVAQDGTVMHGLALIYILRELPQVHAFKIIQESRDCTRIFVVSCHALAPATRCSITAQFRARLGANVAIQIEQVDDIAPETSGKHRYVVSKVHQQ